MQKQTQNSPYPNRPCILTENMLTQKTMRNTRNLKVDGREPGTQKGLMQKMKLDLGSWKKLGIPAGRDEEMALSRRERKEQSVQKQREVECYVWGTRRRPFGLQMNDNIKLK